MGCSNRLVQGEHLTYAAQQNQQKEISRQTSVYKALTIMQKALDFNNMSDVGPEWCWNVLNLWAGRWTKNYKYICGRKV